MPAEQREGFGGVRYYANVDWAGKGQRIASSLASVEQHARASQDPLRGKRFFILAAPETGLQRQPGPKAKSQALVDETVDFRGEHARVFERLGIDLLRVNRDGSATVHAEARSFEKLRAWAAEFTSLGTRDQARWASLANFEWIPPEFKVDETWLAQLDAKKPSEAYIELQPMLERFEADVRDDPLPVEGTETVAHRRHASGVVIGDRFRPRIEASERRSDGFLRVLVADLSAAQMWMKQRLLFPPRVRR